MRAKERLTGAIILVVLIVLVVPELLTGPRATRAPASAAPDEGAPMRSYTIELGEDRSTAKPAQPRANHAPAPIETTPTPPVGTETQTPKPAPSTPKEPASAPVREPDLEAPRASAPRRADPPATGWSVQVGSFASRANAERLSSELRRRGFRSFVTEGTAGGRRLYRVRVGPEADRAATQALAERLRAAGHQGAIVPHP